MLLIGLFVALMLAWLVGMVTATTFNGFLHILLLMAAAVVLVKVLDNEPGI